MASDKEADLDVQVQEEDGEVLRAVDWTIEEEKKAKRK